MSRYNGPMLTRNVEINRPLSPCSSPQWAYQSARRYIIHICPRVCSRDSASDGMNDFRSIAVLLVQTVAILCTDGESSLLPYVSPRFEVSTSNVITASSLMPGMVSLKNEVTEDILSLTSPESAVSRELEFWQTFTFDMDRDQHLNSRKPPNSGKPQRSRSTSTANTTGQHPQMQSTTSGPNLQDAALLVQLAAATAGGNLDQAYSNLISSNPYPSMSPTPGFFGNFLHHNELQPQVPQQLPPLSSLDFPWHGISPHQPQASGSHFDPRHSTSSVMSSLPYLDTQYSSGGPNSAGPSREPKRGKNEEHSTSSPEIEMTEAERIAIADEKRRRNTAASARFRIKKKHKTIGLERSVSDLTGRAEELEREAADLRRENGWLKEIVMLKGTHFAANNIAHRDALTQAAALATGGFVSSSGGGPSGRGAHGDDYGEEASDSDSSDSDDKKSKHKGKGKKASTRKK